MILALVALSLQLHAVSADQSCAATSSLGRQPGIFLTIVGQSQSDTLLRAVVCYVGNSTASLGSYHGRLFYDSTRITAVSAEDGPRGFHAENIGKRGVVDFAGASASGFENGPLLEVLFRAPRGYRPALRLEMIEANAVTRGTLLPQLKIVGVLQTDSAQAPNLSGSCPRQSSSAPAPTLTRLVPSVVPLDSLTRGAVVTIQAEGCGFDKDRNIVRLGRFVIAEVPSNSDGTKISFAFPMQIPTGGEVAPPKPVPGSYAVSVSKGSLTSNSLTLEVR